MNLSEVGRAAGLDRLEGRRVLVVEDLLEHHAAMLAWLGTEGVEAIGLIAVDRIDSPILWGENAEGKTISIDLTTVGTAFLDYYFPIAPWNGRRLTQALVPQEVRCFGMSSVDDANARMVAAGAVGSLRKRILAGLLPTRTR